MSKETVETVCRMNKSIKGLIGAAREVVRSYKANEYQQYVLYGKKPKELIERRKASLRNLETWLKKVEEE